jgi:adenylate kinase
MNEEVIRRRLKTYFDETFKTLSFYPAELVYDIDAGKTPLEVLQAIVDRMVVLQRAHRMPRTSTLVSPIKW